MWKMCKEFLRRRTDIQLLLMILSTLLILILTLICNLKFNVSDYITLPIAVIDGCVMMALMIEGLRRGGETSLRRLREELKEQVRKELEQEHK